MEYHKNGFRRQNITESKNLENKIWKGISFLICKEIFYFYISPKKYDGHILRKTNNSEPTLKAKKILSSNEHKKHTKQAEIYEQDRKMYRKTLKLNSAL